MSYELMFFPKAAGQSWDQVMAAAEREDHSGPLDAAAWERFVAEARRIAGEVSTRRDEECFELTHPPSHIQVHLFVREALLTVPYWFTGMDAATLLDLAFRLGRAVESATGLVGYDPQLEEALSEAEVGRAVLELDTLGAKVVRGMVLGRRDPAG